MRRTCAPGTKCTPIYNILHEGSGWQWQHVDHILKKRTHDCRFNHEILARISICELFWRNHGAETHGYVTDGTALLGVFKKYGRGWV